MAVRSFEMVSQRTELAKSVLAGLDTYQQDIAGYGDVLALGLEEGETPVDTQFEITLMRRRVIWHLDRVQNLDTDVLIQVHGDDKVRVEIVRLTGVVDGKLRSVRHTCKGVYGVESLARVGLKGNFPRRPTALYDRCRIVQASLRSPDVELRPVFELSDDGEPPIKPELLADQFEPELTDLGRAIEVRHAEIREAADVRSRRRQVIREFDRDIRAIVRMTQGMLRLAGRPDLAKRFRSTLPRFGRRSAGEEGTVTQTTTP